MAGNPEQQTVDQDECGGGSDMAAAAVVAPRRKVRMHPDDVRFTLSLKPGEDLVGTDDLDSFAHKFSPEQLEEKRQLREEMAAMLRKDDEEMEARQAQVARELAEKGYVEIDEVDPAAEEEYDRMAAEMWKSMTDQPWFKRIDFADPRDVQDGAPGWTVRRYDAEEDQDEDEYDDYDDEDEYEDEENEVEAEVKDEDEQDKAEDGKEDTTNVQTKSDGETAALINPTTTD